MKKQILKGVWAASLVGALAVLSVPAEAAEISAKIPFSFVVNGKTLPPGTYQVTTQVVPGALFVRGFSDGAFILATSMQSNRDTDAKLVFHKYGDRYILRQAWLGNGNGRQLPESRLERELARTERSGKLASTLERVVIAGF